MNNLNLIFTTATTLWFWLSFPFIEREMVYIHKLRTWRLWKTGKFVQAFIKVKVLVIILKALGPTFNDMGTH